MTTEQKNMELMQTLDDAWNAQDWDTFDKPHKPDVVVRWPAQPPTHGRHDHRAEGVQMFKTFPDNKVHNRPYKTFFASGDWTCSSARFTGTMKGPMARRSRRQEGRSRCTSAPSRAGRTARSSKRTFSTMSSVS